jgi:hypothetical protein
MAYAPTCMNIEPTENDGKNERVRGVEQSAHLTTHVALAEGTDRPQDAEGSGRRQRSQDAKNNGSPSQMVSEHEIRDSNARGWWTQQHLNPDVGRVANGVASRVDRLKAIGNGQVPSVAQLAWETLNT